MSKNYLSIQIGGEQRGLKYNMAAMEAIVELTGNQDLGMVVTKDLVINVYAGLVGNAIAKDEEPNIDIKVVKKWIGILEFDEALDLSQKVEAVIVTAYKRKEASGEGSADTQPAALNVA